jgi:hypothetical protein
VEERIMEVVKQRQGAVAGGSNGAAGGGGGDGNGIVGMADSDDDDMLMHMARGGRQRTNVRMQVGRCAGTADWVPCWVLAGGAGHSCAGHCLPSLWHCLACLKTIKTVSCFNTVGAPCAALPCLQDLVGSITADRQQLRVGELEILFKVGGWAGGWVGLLLLPVWLGIISVVGAVPFSDWAQCKEAQLASPQSRHGM